MKYYATIKCLVCGNEFLVETKKEYSGSYFSGVSGIPKHECKQKEHKVNWNKVQTLKLPKYKGVYWLKVKDITRSLLVFFDGDHFCNILDLALPEKNRTVFTNEYIEGWAELKPPEWDS